MNFLRGRRGAAWAVASGFGSGLSPVAPGTAGSAVGLLFGWLLLKAGSLPLVLGVCVATAAGLWAIPPSTGIKLLGRSKRTHDDPGWVVIDEIAGQMVCMLALHRADALGLALAFGLFRFFDIVKPGPIGWADRQGGALGIMADDVLAGGAAAIVLAVVQEVGRKSLLS